MSDKPKRRWPRFSLRALLLLITLLCVGPGGIVTYERQKRLKRWRVAAEIESLGGDLAYVPPNVLPRDWHAVVFGDDIELNGVIFVGDDRVTDNDLGLLATFPELRQLTLCNTQISDAGLVHLEHLSQLEWLDLSQTRVTNSGLTNLEGLARLEVLYLTNTEITDDGLARLRRLESFRTLTHLKLDDTRITRAAAERLEADFPDKWIDITDYFVPTLP